MSIDDQNVGPEKFEPFSPPEEAPPRSGRGCLFWGCLISSILMILLLVAIILAVLGLRNVVIKALEENTETQPVQLPELTLSPEEQQNVIQRWDTFRADMDSGKPAKIALDGEEFNVIARHLVGEAEGKVHFRIEGDQLKGQVSIPVGDIGKRFLRTDRLAGRYFNGEGAFDVFLRNGVFVLTLQDATVNGKPIPADALEQLKTQNLAESLNNDPEQRALFSKLSVVKVEDGKLILETSAASAEASETPPASEPAPSDTQTATPEAPAPEAPPAEASESSPGETPAPEAEKPASEAPAGESPTAESPGFLQAA